jgi:hypothetical protein
LKVTAVTANAGATRAWSKSFYVWLSIAFVATAFLGFAPTYWAPLSAGKFAADPIVHIHGLVFFSWTLFFFAQTTFVGSGQTARHREIGIVGVSLATLMTVLGILVALNSLRGAEAHGFGPQGEAFMVLPLFDIVPFAIFVALAVANTRNPEVHKRLMVLSMVAVLDAATARPFLAYVFTNVPPGPPPVWIAYPADAVVDMLLAAAMIYDWRSRGRPHPVYLWGGAAILATQLIKVPLSGTPAWHAFARAFLGLLG